MDINSTSPRNSDSNGPNECGRCAELKAISADLLAAANLALKVAEGYINVRPRWTTGFDETMAGLQPVRDAIAKAEGEPAP